MMETSKLLKRLEESTGYDHIRRLRVKRGEGHRLSPAIDRNQNRWLNIFLSGNMLTEGCKAVFYYDDSEEPFAEQTFTELIHNAYDEWLIWIIKKDLRRVGFKGEFRIRIEIIDTNGSEVCKIKVPIRGKVGRKLKYT